MCVLCLLAVGSCVLDIVHTAQQGRCGRSGASGAEETEDALAVVAGAPCDVAKWTTPGASVGAAEAMEAKASAAGRVVGRTRPLTYTRKIPCHGARRRGWPRANTNRTDGHNLCTPGAKRINPKDYTRAQHLTAPAGTLSSSRVLRRGSQRWQPIWTQ
jgi:hypothetical protein